MNTGSARGGAYGYKLETLEKVLSLFSHFFPHFFLVSLFLRNTFIDQVKFFFKLFDFQISSKKEKKYNFFDFFQLLRKEKVKKF